MEFDLTTVLIILGITHLMQILVFLYQYKTNRGIPGPGWWLAWSIAEFTGVILIFLRSVPSLLPVSILLQNATLVGGALLLYTGLQRFFEKREDPRPVIFLYLFYCFIHQFFYLIYNDIRIRTILFTGVLAIIGALTAVLLFRNRDRQNRMIVTFNMWVFLFHSAMYLAIMVITIYGSPVSDETPFSASRFLPYLDGLLVTLLWTFGLIMLINQRLNTEIAEAKEHFEMIFTTGPDAVVISSLEDGSFVDCNDFFIRLSGFPREEIIGKKGLTDYWWVYPEQRDRLIDTVRNEGACENLEVTFRRKDGEHFTGLMSGKILRIKGVPHMLTVTRDISDRKRAEEEIRRKNRELREINASKDKFFSILAHDLRNPFNLFLGMTEFMADSLPDLPVGQLQQVAVRMRDSAANLFRLLENLLEWSRMEQGAIPFSPAWIPLTALVTESRAMVRESALVKGITIREDIPESLEIFCDRYIIQSVLRNLLSNAVKFTPRGGTITITSDTGDKGFTEVSVRDTGIGMDREMLENLFSLDAQTRRPGTEGEPSTGLGLILCKAFIEKHGGMIMAESSVGEGSAFKFIVPCPTVKVVG